MTHNQIEYWNLQETKRHNIAGESETNRHNVVGENESSRHNQATEAIDIGKLNETVRHNTVTEGETERHNRETENIGYGQLNESIRHNTVTESIQSMDAQTRVNQLDETIRHNQAVESIDRTGTTSSAINDISNAASRWISTPVIVPPKRKGTKPGIAAGIKAASKAITSFDPVLVPKAIFRGSRIKPNLQKGSIST